MSAAPPDPGAVCLAVDLGTGGPKVGYVRLNGEILWSENQRVETTWLPRGGAIQDAAKWWGLVCDSARRGLKFGSVDADEVVAVSCTGQWASTVPVAASGEPVGPCILWSDSRGRPYSKKVIGGPVAGYAPRPALQWIRRAGGAPSGAGADPIGHILFLLNEEPETVAAAEHFLEPVDYLSLRFSGRAAASHASMTAAWLTDNRHLDVMEYDPVLLKLAGLDRPDARRRLPPLVPTGSVIGTVLDEVATDLGLPPGVQVVTGTPDLHSAACGAGAVGDFETHLAVSTTAWIGAPVPFKKTDALHSIVSVPGLRADRYIVANNHETGGYCLEWCRDAMFPGASYDELVAEAATAPEGSGDILFTPWLNGERSPVDDRRARGGFHNLSVSTTRRDLARAVLEGVAFNNRWLHEAVESFAGRRLEPVKMIGGGAQSDLWCQIHADVMDRRVDQVTFPLHANLRGAAVFAGLSLGALRPETVAELVGVRRCFEPSGATRTVYDRLFGEFPKLYKQQRSMFSRLNG